MTNNSFSNEQEIDDQQIDSHTNEFNTNRQTLTAIEYREIVEKIRAKLA